MCPVDADVDVYVDADIGFFQFGKNDAWDPISVTDKTIIVEAFTQEGDFTQRITASLNRLMENYLFVMMGTLKDMATISFQICITVA